MNGKPAIQIRPTLAVASSWASLVLVPSYGGPISARLSGLATGAGLAIGATMIIIPIVILPEWSHWYWGVLGAVAISTVLATIVAIATRSAPVADGDYHQRVAQAAAARGVTTDVFVREAVERALADTTRTLGGNQRSD